MMETTKSKKTTMKIALLVLNIILLAIGNCAGPLIMRLYFLHGGKRIWFSSWLETAGCPVILIPITVSYLQRRRRSATTDHESSTSSQPSNNDNNKLILMRPPVFFASAIIGILTGFDNYLYAYGVARLPVSTSSLIIASQLAFTAAFAFLLVKQKLTSYSLNAVFLLTLGAVVLGLHTNGDRPDNESARQYLVGFLMTVGAAVLYGFVLPLMELTYKKARQEITYALVLEIQTVMCLFATLVCTVGMVVNKDFQAIGKEARAYTLGEGKYYAVVVASALIWQCFFLGAIGVIYCGSSLLSAIIIAVLLPVTEILAVIFYKEKFQAEKGVSLALSLWGFASYFYGEIKNKKKMKKREQLPETEMPITNP